MDLKAGEDTRLLYCTTGVLREKLIGKKNMHQYTHVILDEVRRLCACLLLPAVLMVDLPVGCGGNFFFNGKGGWGGGQFLYLYV